MQLMANQDTSNDTSTRERAQRRALESMSLTDESAGARVSEIVRSRLDAGAHRVIVTHSAHEIPIEIIEHAFEALRYSGIVCAPGEAGDIALIGMTQAHDALLAAIPWGSRDALDRLLGAAREGHVPVVLLPPGGGQRPRAS
jgi:glycosyltransferase A (GT-A) superfamily protein (DUF2064 family)